MDSCKFYINYNGQSIDFENFVHRMDLKYLDRLMKMYLGANTGLRNKEIRYTTRPAGSSFQTFSAENTKPIHSDVDVKQFGISAADSSLEGVIVVTDKTSSFQTSNFNTTASVASNNDDVTLSLGQWTELTNCIKKLETVVNVKCPQSSARQTRVNNMTHKNVKCNGCVSKNSNHNDIRGYRYKCVVCPEFNLCDQCESQNFEMFNHSSAHNMIKFKNSELQTSNASYINATQNLSSGQLSNPQLSNGQLSNSSNPEFLNAIKVSVKQTDFNYAFKVENGKKALPGNLTLEVQWNQNVKSVIELGESSLLSNDNKIIKYNNFVNQSTRPFWKPVIQQVRLMTKESKPLYSGKNTNDYNGEIMLYPSQLSQVNLEQMQRQFNSLSVTENDVISTATNTNISRDNDWEELDLLSEDEY
ncbi:hypothetical protein Kpol_1053p42 [Vanderwaltozyma polyspora DSM 70294]|uniref:ZZ-type domain-containing protein n=1 Tax=Vanderwaltozyma polyspora (strain ATCC 22028 / DSM 70294 / BCRC 21397 / CBS 2163 / NBRC 10782 / NRRL Y-8283 / UCD 57-17) TaxID=436907 RepID=A7TN86_VANPO|nr:uncharacterized protein Kpol_1053p42 [Vanderwaltozyma polyspora DSM 70294]EDO16304.1 hypothetical protein Kpol_1053p42 [Vanderwaltozyma polyspora DSM 70294]